MRHSPLSTPYDKDDPSFVLSCGRPMTAPLKTVEASTDLPGLMTDIGLRARAAARILALAPTALKDQALAAMAKAILASAGEILGANAEDLAEARASGATGAFLDRLALDPARLTAMAEGLQVVRGLSDPVG